MAGGETGRSDDTGAEGIGADGHQLVAVAGAEVGGGGFGGDDDHSGGIAGDSAGAADLRGRAGGFDLGDEFGDARGHDADGIEEMKNEELRMMNDKSWYELGGRKLAGKPTQKGVYIVNGKKIIK